MRSKVTRLFDVSGVCLGIGLSFCFALNKEPAPTSDTCAFLEQIVVTHADKYKARRTDSDGSINLQHTIRNRYARCPQNKKRSLK